MKEIETAEAMAERIRATFQKGVAFNHAALCAIREDRRVVASAALAKAGELLARAKVAPDISTGEMYMNQAQGLTDFAADLLGGAS